MRVQVDPVTSAEQVEVFQELLDRFFPIGALCVEFVTDGERLTTTGVEMMTGRVLCTGAEPTDSGWRHRLLIDPRRRAGAPVDAYEIWISSLRRHDDVDSLWEATVASDDGQERVLRLLSDPEPPWRPTAAMRRAVTKAHQA